MSNEDLPVDVFKQLLNEQPSENNSDSSLKFSPQKKKTPAILILTAILFAILAGILSFEFLFTDLTGDLREYLKNNPGRGNVSFNLKSPALFRSNMVLDIESIDSNDSMADVFHNFLRACKFIKDKKFERLYLAYKGENKFYLEGNFARNLGKQYGDENTVWLLRTFPENVYTLNNEKRFSFSAIGAGVLSRQEYENFSVFSKEWYLESK